MDALTLQSRINRGYGKAAVRLGQLNDVCRPTGPANPLVSKVFSLLASFNAEDWKYIKPNKYGKSTWYGLFDRTLTQQGDYLVGPQGIFFIAEQQLHLSTLCVECNRKVALLRQTAPVNPTGAQPYGGVCITEETAALGTVTAGVVTYGWPASILLLGRADNQSVLPMAVKNAGFQILLPASVPVVIHASDVLLDDLGRRYIIEGAELTDAGWRMNAKEAHI
jgi:hypothetical protein